MSVMIVVMEGTTIIQGRWVSPDDIAFIRRLIAQNPDWHRTRLSREVCVAWHWRNPKGRLKDMACRSLLLKLERAGHVTLPPARRPANNHLRNRSIEQAVTLADPIQSALRDRMPIGVAPVEWAEQGAMFASFLAHHHYLGYRGHVGENMKYLIFDREGRALACLLFGSAAWKVASRDAFIGWDAATRQRRLHLVTNNMRFLILPWVRVPHLASHLLSRVARRINADWMDKYGHPIHVLETFVERGRFRGVCYQAANWIHVGQTRGRSRNDRDQTMRVPIKDVYVYPLCKQFREVLGGDGRLRQSSGSYDG